VHFIGCSILLLGGDDILSLPDGQAQQRASTLSEHMDTKDNWNVKEN